MIPQFTDATGKVWRIEITAGLLRRVRLAFGIELGSILLDDDRLCNLLYADPEGFANVLFESCRSQHNGREGETFLDGINDRAIDEAREGLMEAIANFTLPPAISKAFVANWRIMLKDRTEKAAAKLTTAILPPTSSEPALLSPA